jgi:hypothetical protein
VQVRSSSSSSAKLEHSYSYSCALLRRVNYSNRTQCSAAAHAERSPLFALCVCLKRHVTHV